MKKPHLGYLLLFIPSLTWAASLSCDQLAKSAEHSEKSLRLKFSQEQCDAPVDKDCSTLATIETRLTQLQNARALLDGVEKLKNEIKEQKQLLSSKSPKASQKAALSFADAVVVAQSMELLVAQEDVLPALKKSLAPDKPFEFSKALEAFCKDKPQNKYLACSKENFQPSPRAIEEITGVLQNVEINGETITKWQNALKIKKVIVNSQESDEYSFAALRRELSGSDHGEIPSSYSADQIKVMQKISDFKDDSDLDFMRNINSDRSNIVVREKFRILIEELSKRQQLDLSAKVSVAYANYSQNLSPAPRSDVCGSAKTDYKSAVECLSDMKAGRNASNNSVAKGELGRFVEAAELTANYLSEIQSKSQDCLEKIDSSMKLSSELTLSACEGLISQDLAKSEADIAKLVKLKDKILDDNKDLLKIRNYALSQLDEKDCLNSNSSTIGSCDPSLQSALSPEMVSLSSNAMNISILLNKAEIKGDAEFKQACGTEAFRAIPEAKTLCVHSENEADIARVNESNQNVQPRVQRRSRPRVKEEESPVALGLAQGFALYGPQTAQYIAQMNLARINPQSLYYNPYPQISNPIFAPSPADYLTLQGLTYQPTPGLSLYSSFPTQTASSNLYTYR